MGLEDGNDVIVDDGTVSDGDGNGNGSGQRTATEEQSRIRDLEKQTIKNQIYAELLADPDYMSVMQAKRSGRKVKVIPLSEDGSDPTVQPVDHTPTPALDFETASPKDIHEFTLKGVESMLKKLVPDMIKSAQAPLEQRIGQIGGVIQTTAEERLANEIKRVSSKYPDFNTYMDKMVEIQKSNPGLDIEELYGIAKKRSGAPLTQNRATMSERSSNQTTARSPRSQESPTKSGVTNRLDFRSLLQKAAVNAINSVDQEVRGIQDDAQE